MRRAISVIWKFVTHPAFWMPVILVVAVSYYEDGLQLHARRIMSDGWGYYLPLPAIFVYNDPHLVFLNRLDLASDVLQYRSAAGTWQGLHVFGAGYLDKYAFGPAVLQLPFFLFALLVGRLSYVSLNGFEPVFQIAGEASGAFYFALGSFLIFRTCRLRYGVLPSALVPAAVILGSNILQYASIEASFSHTYGYCLVAGLMYVTVSQAESAEPPSIFAFVLFGTLIGLAVMTRPTNAVYSLLFVVFARRTSFRELMLGGTSAFLASAIAASPQMIWWLVTTGQPIYYSYTGEGFNFASPELANYLFSIRKGLFFWHPLYLLMMVTLLAGLRRRPLESAISLLVVALAIYLGASWSDYAFGHSFGSRNSIELLPLLAVPCAGAVAGILTSRWKWAVAAFAALLIAVNLIQFRGYIKSTIPHKNSTLATYARFWALTLRTPAIESLLLAAPEGSTGP